MLWGAGDEGWELKERCGLKSEQYQPTFQATSNSLMLDSQKINDGNINISSVFILEIL